MKKIFNSILTFMVRREKAIVASVITLLLLGGLLYTILLDDQLRYIDEEDYYVIAQNIVTRAKFSLDGEKPTAYRPPGFPFYLSVFVMLGLPIQVLRFMNFVALSISIIIIQMISRKAGKPAAGVMAAVIILLYPVLFYAAGTFFPQTVGTMFLLAVIYLMLYGRKTIQNYFVTGILSGIAVLMIPPFLVAVVITALFAYLPAKGERLKAFGIVFLAISLLIGVWAARNYIAFDRFILISNNFGENLLIGNFEDATAGSGTHPSIYNKYGKRDSFPSEAIRDAHFRDAAIDYMLKHPGRTIGLYCLKYLNYFSLYNNLVTESERSVVFSLIMIATYGPLLLLFIARLLSVKWFALERFDWLVIILYFANPLVYAVFFTRIRFRLPFDVLLIAMIAIFLVNLAHRFTGERTSQGNAASDPEVA